MGRSRGGDFGDIRHCRVQKLTEDRFQTRCSFCMNQIDKEEARSAVMSVTIKAVNMCLLTTESVRVACRKHAP